jgi:hypothetical protein
MQPLLTTDHPTYLRRLVRAINQAVAAGGAYAGSNRVVRVRFTGRIVATLITGQGTATYDMTHDTTWVDGYGRAICASRQVRA